MVVIDMPCGIRIRLGGMLLRDGEVGVVRPYFAAHTRRIHLCMFPTPLRALSV